MGIPTELLQHIAGYLFFNEKLACALACRDWYSAIAIHGPLYEQLEFLDQRSFKAATTFFRKKKSEKLNERVYQVHFGFECDATKLPAIFPNLKILELDEDYQNPGYYDPVGDYTTSKNYEQAIRKWKYLENVEQKNEFTPVVIPLLKSPSPYTRLTSITMSYYVEGQTNPRLQEMYAISYKEKIKVLLPLLKNAPNLKSLSLEKVFLTLSDMENLHDKYAPNLEKLSLTKTLYMFTVQSLNELLTLTYPNEQPNKNIVVKKPAEKLTKLEISFSHDIDMFHVNHRFDEMPSKWVEYVTQKYTNVKELTLSTANVKEEYLKTGIFEKYVTPAFPWKHLQQFSSKLIALSPKVLDAMDNAGVRLKELLLHLDKDGLLMSQVSALKLSKQASSIKRLTIHSKDFIDQNTTCGKAILMAVEACTQLEKFELLQFQKFSRLQLEINMLPEILKRAPQLTNMLVEKLAVDASLPAPTIKLPETKLREVVIGNMYVRDMVQGVRVSNMFNKVIFPACPHLEVFDIYVGRLNSQYDSIQSEMELKFNLPASITGSDISFFDSDIINITYNNKTQWYEQRDGCDFIPIKKPKRLQRYVSYILQNPAMIRNRWYGSF